MSNHSPRTLHCFMSSQHSGIEQSQNRLIVEILSLIESSGVRLSRKRLKNDLSPNIKLNACAFSLGQKKQPKGFPAASCMFWIKNILWYALKRKVLSISTRTSRMMFSLSFVGGSKSAEGGPYPQADLDRGGPYPLGDLGRGVQI